MSLSLLGLKEQPSGSSYSSAGYGVAKGGAKTGGGPKFGGSNVCPRCGKSVYAAEKVMGAGSVSEPELRCIINSYIV